MRVAVVRHEADQQNLDAWLETAGRILGEGMEAEPLTMFRLEGVLTMADALLKNRSLADPTAQQLESWHAWVAAMQASSAMFAALQADGSAQCRIGFEGKVRSIPASGPCGDTHAGNWLTAFWLAAACRDKRRMDELCTVTVDQLRAYGAVFDDFVYAWVAAVQAYWRADADLMEHLLAAIDGTDPEVATVTDREILLKVLYPPIAAFYRLVQRDEEKFAEAMQRALELHREYFTADEERADGADSLVSLPLMGIACLAREAGLNVEIESDYLPKHILLGSWVGEFEA
ncbi:immunity 49 family protein [Kitasatospora griseola]|uniref:immunity 49 family protein n=1 Tax=Kitasatospora griseola TaxID=2064 RepID=UPI003440F898